MQGQQRPQSRNVIFARAVHARLRLLAAASQSSGGRGRGETAGSGCRACPPESDDRHFSTKTAQHSVIHLSIILCTLSPSPMQCRTGLLRSWLRPPASASTPSLQPPQNDSDARRRSHHMCLADGASHSAYANSQWSNYSIPRKMSGRLASACAPCASMMWPICTSCASIPRS